MNPLAMDLDHVLEHTEGLWEELRGERIFITGGTGFFGCWFLESFLWANDRLDLKASATVLTRNPDAFRKRAPHLALHNSIALQTGDVRSFVSPEGTFSHVIHAATESSTTLNDREPLTMLETIIDGTRRVLDFAATHGVRKLLLTSSGAVYGTQPPGLPLMDERYGGAPDTMEMRSAYGEGKRVAELLCAIYHRDRGLETKIARCFAFVGPYLPLDAHFAVGNFIADALAKRPIRVKGDGTAHRSYLYAADLVIWLWTILIKGLACRPYNVGSEDSVSIAELASLVSDTFSSGQGVSVQQITGRRSSAERYVPATQRSREELLVSQKISFDAAIRRTFEWHAGVREK